MNNPLKTISRLSVGLALCTAPFAISVADEAQLTTLPSLVVKERLQSIEQINVTAETEQQEEQPVSAAVAQLLDEAQQLDAPTEE